MFQWALCQELTGYVDRLTGLYEEMGVSISREPYGLDRNSCTSLAYHTLLQLLKHFLLRARRKYLVVQSCGNIIPGI